MESDEARMESGSVHHQHVVSGSSGDSKEKVGSDVKETKTENEGKEVFVLDDKMPNSTEGDPAQPGGTPTTTAASTTITVTSTCGDFDSKSTETTTNKNSLGSNEQMDSSSTTKEQGKQGKGQSTGEDTPATTTTEETANNEVPSSSPSSSSVTPIVQDQNRPTVRIQLRSPHAGSIHNNNNNNNNHHETLGKSRKRKHSTSHGQSQQQQHQQQQQRSVLDVEEDENEDENESQLENEKAEPANLQRNQQERKSDQQQQEQRPKQTTSSSSSNDNNNNNNHRDVVGEEAADDGKENPTNASTTHNRNSISTRTTATKKYKRSQQSSQNQQQQGSTTTVLADTSSAETTTTAPATTTSTSTSTPPNPPPPLTQPNGWRVKLYRLNMDGSWDDCGTGRIVCLYRQPQQQQQQQQVKPREGATQTNTTTADPAGADSKSQETTRTAPETDKDATTAQDKPAAETTASTDTATASTNTTSTTATTTVSETPQQQQQAATTAPPPASPPVGSDAWLYQETGEATLCVQAEVTTRATQPRILLRTRILLRDAYQRQGDNIITWCEPFYHNGTTTTAAAGNNKNMRDTGSNNNNNELAASHEQQQRQEHQQGVDLALSFQDNAGCLDIWRQITHVQGLAAQLIRSSAAAAAAALAGSGTAADHHHASMEDMAARIAARHHAELQQSQNDHLWSNNNNRTADDKENGHRSTGGGGLLVHHHHHHNHQHHSSAAGDLVSSSASYNDNFGGGMLSHRNSNNNSGLFASLDGSIHAQQIQQQQQLQHQQQQLQQQPTLPHPPSLQNLEEIADTIAAYQHVQQRENLALWIGKDDCQYLKLLLQLFEAAEMRGDFGKLATLAACVKTILLLNDPSILELIVNESDLFECVCSCLEYDPDLRERANHRVFLRQRARFRTVLPMKDPDLIQAIHRSFRVNYLRDTLLRPTMDESSLSTLSSLQIFTHTGVVKGVRMREPTPAQQKQPPSQTSAPHSETGNNNEKSESNDSTTMSSSENEEARSQQLQQQQQQQEEDTSYLLRVVRLLGNELHAIACLEWDKFVDQVLCLHNTNEKEETKDNDENKKVSEEIMPTAKNASNNTDSPRPRHQEQQDPSLSSNGGTSSSGTWKQYLAPQDDSLSSRRLRRRGCICFLRELFNMARVSLQQADKDDFFSYICTVPIDLAAPSNNNSNNQRSAVVPPRTPTFLLSLMGSVLNDPTADLLEKESVLDILLGVAWHDPGLIRNHCLDSHSRWKQEREELQLQQKQPSSVEGFRWTGKPEPNPHRQVILLTCPPMCILASLLYLLNTETDSGVLLQVSEILRILLDISDVLPAGSTSLAQHQQLDPGQFMDAEEDNRQHQFGCTDIVSPNPHVMDANALCEHFLNLFYEYYVEWTVAAFQFTLFYPVLRVPDHVMLGKDINHNTSTDGNELTIMQRLYKTFQKGIRPQLRQPHNSLGDSEKNRDESSHAVSDEAIAGMLLQRVPTCASRSSFAEMELLIQNVRVHRYRMRSFLLKSRVLSNILRLLRPIETNAKEVSGPWASELWALSKDRCFKLAALRLLRAILSVNDEFYHRHIIQHDLFGPIFETFRTNPVGDNLVSSAIVEMCDYIRKENIHSLLEYIVTKHLEKSGNSASEASTNATAAASTSWSSTSTAGRSNEDGILSIPSLEDVSSPYVTTLTSLREAYETRLSAMSQRKSQAGNNTGERGSSYFASAGDTSNIQPVAVFQNDDNNDSESIDGGSSSGSRRIQPSQQKRHLSGRALEDQRKFQQVDEEEAYFDSVEEDVGNNAVAFDPSAGDGDSKRSDNADSVP